MSTPLHEPTRAAPAVDFPAAHSMDSTWFAVDSEGQVALFDTGEGGALPTEDRFPKGGEAGGADGLSAGDVLVALLRWRSASLPALHALLMRTEGWEERLDEQLWECEEVEKVGLVAWLGLYYYGCSDAIAQPYERGAVVVAPLRQASLPLDLRRRLESAGLPLRFDRSPRVAVAEHVPAVAWDPHWVDLQGGLRRFDGRAADPSALGDLLELETPSLVDQAVALEDAAALQLLEALFARAEAPLPEGARAEGAEAGAGQGVLGWLRRLFGG
jgi:hypothetical protein